jgi:hypothetical protein
MLFNRSVRDNIALADPAMPMAQIVAAAALAAHEFVLQLPEYSSASAAATCPVVSVNASQWREPSPPTPDPNLRRGDERARL